MILPARAPNRIARTAFAGLVVLGAAPATAGQPRDARITAKVESALTESVASDGLDVDTSDGRVTLRGRVESEASRSRAANATRRIAGVREVRNLIEVGGERAEARAGSAAIAARGARGLAGVP